MARYWCQRCKQESNTLDEPHLCADLKKRYERNKKAVEIVKNIFNQYNFNGMPDLDETNLDDVAADIVKALAGRDLGVD